MLISHYYGSLYQNEYLYVFNYFIGTLVEKLSKHTKHNGLDDNNNFSEFLITSALFGNHYKAWHQIIHNRIRNVNSQYKYTVLY